MSFDEVQLELRNLEPVDYEEVSNLMDLVYADIGGAWSKKTINDLIKRFQEGQLCITINGKIVGVALTIQVKYSQFSNPHKYEDLIGPEEIIHHEPEGDSLYGLDVFVHPEFRDYRLGRRLYEARKELCRSWNLRGILAGGRIPGYRKHCEELTAKEYIEKVQRREIHDPILSFQLSNDFTVKRLLRRYLPEDKKSGGYATLLEWSNFLYEPEVSVVESIKTNVRLGAVQWQMRKFSSVEEVLRQIEYFVDTLSGYRSDFAVFPELFNTPLLALADTENPSDAIRFLAQFTEKFREEMCRMAVTYNINIIGGSMPVIENDMVYNICYLFHRNGHIDEQRKLHVTHQEKKDWIIEGGDELQVFETDAGKVGILICYDVEFPELGRILSEQGMEILFVPFWTDTKNGYLRVRHCARARAIENECYVAIVGSVGNLPSVANLDVQYSQSSVFSPSDFAFPHDATMAETTPNTEMIMFSDLDLDRLKLIRNEGTVTNMKDRRRDLYKITFKGKKLRE
jgi:predicted amidohydrolase/GNAT superfamily N-acetyltransferase